MDYDLTDELRSLSLLDSVAAMHLSLIHILLSNWMQAMSLCKSRAAGGRGLLIGETYPTLARSLMLWDPRVVASNELADRIATGLPPIVSAACIWGRRDAVERALHNIGIANGDWAWVEKMCIRDSHQASTSSRNV